ncbi:MAG: OsmC family protein [Armatimonadetes bacterium]|nr:OsmC family protein [Armatimonadota bacterium]
MIRTATAVWNGSALEGSGTFSVGSGVLGSIPFSFAQRFGDEPGTNPEELIAAAHASCFSMALSFGLGNAGHPPERVSTDAKLTMEKQPDGWAVTAVHLTVRAKVPGLSPEAFQDAARSAKEGCPVSKLLKAEITMDATLEA